MKNRVMVLRELKHMEKACVYDTGVERAHWTLRRTAQCNYIMRKRILLSWLSIRSLLSFCDYDNEPSSSLITKNFLNIKLRVNCSEKILWQRVTQSPTHLGVISETKSWLLVESIGNVLTLLNFHMVRILIDISEWPICLAFH